MMETESATSYLSIGEQFDLNQQHPKDNRGFVEHWRRAAAMLEKIRDKELREFDHRASADAIDALLQMGVDFGEERTTSGLVELQRRLHQGRL